MPEIEPTLTGVTGSEMQEPALGVDADAPVTAHAPRTVEKRRQNSTMETRNGCTLALFMRSM
jgi:hypothetical protein